MPLNPRFISYFEETFFQNKKEEFKTFLTALEKSIPRTIRVQPGKEKEVRERLQGYGFLLGETYIPNVFTLDRSEDFDPLERRIGFTPDHLVGNFYIQELAAATSVHVLTEGKIYTESFVILDMASSPGGKTTQLSEHYPKSFIIANEPTRERIPQLLQNLDRMGSGNIWVTLYPGQYYRHSPETFDRILLDAPCSWEGTLYKGTEATKHWHIKNIKNIASLQVKLLDAAIIALKVGGTMVYSTCSMNLLENEGVLEAIEKKYPKTFKITYQKRFWPHRDGTGGFFVAKLEKIAAIPKAETSRPISVNMKIERVWKIDITGLLKKDINLFSHEGKLLALRSHPEVQALCEKYYFMRLGEKIGTHENWKTLLDAFAYRYLSLDEVRTYEIPNEETLDQYLRGGSIAYHGSDWPILLVYNGITISLEDVIMGHVSNNFPRDWRRK